ncbi:MAG: Ig-like domain-containing protein [Clostridia bacterium]|nr:Ig-like domain-containing protein [Clostridia bacterium]
MKTKRVLSLALAISMALSLLIIPANAASFTDVSGHWAEKLIEQAVAHGYVPAGGAFEPNKAITRNEFARMVNGAFGLTNAASISFSDVPASDPYYKDVQKAVFAGYISGYEDNTFRGTNLITRQEAAVILARLVAYPNEALKTMTLKDTSSIGAWALPAAKIVYTKGYMTGDNLQKFNPLGNLTRAETVKILETLLTKEKIISGNITINAKNETVLGNIYTGNLIIADSVGRSSVQLTNCKVLGTLLVNGGGETGIRLSNTGVANMTVDSQYYTPGVAAVGDSTVYNTYLKTNSQLVESNISGMGAGFKNVTIGGAAAKVSLTGTTYDNVAINVPSSVTLTSGKITNLNVGAAAVGTSVKLESGTNVANAVLNATAVFTGTGTVTKTTTNTGAGAGATAAGALAYTSTPANGTTKVATSTVINISFEDAIVPSNGQTLTTSWVRSNVALRKNTSTGTSLDYSASISSNGKVLTIDPVAGLDKSSEYLLTVNAGAFKGQTNGKLNDTIAILFTTDGKAATSSSSSSSIITTDEMVPEFYPGDETNNIPVDANLTLTFDEKVYDENGKSLTSSYLKSDVIELRKGSESGTAVAFTASINSAKKVITINPSSNLTKNTTYYLIVNEGTLTNDDDDSNDELIYSFKTASRTSDVPLSYPASGTQTMETDEDFVFVFPTEVFDEDGDPLTSSYIKNYVFEVREGSKTGKKVTLEKATINSDKDTITLIPDGLLDSDTEYFVILSSGALTNADGDDISGMTFNYYTGGENGTNTNTNNNKPTTSGDLAPIETSPEHKETKIKSSANIKMLFDGDLYTSAGKKVTSSTLADAIEIRKNSQTGSKVSFTASYDTSYGYKVVELDPKTNLSVGATYYVIIKEGKLFDEDGLSNDKYVFYFTVGTASTDELTVDVEPGTTSAALTIDYDYSDTDATKLQMTVSYNKENGTLSSWKNVTYTINNVKGTKVVNLTGLTKNTDYEYEVEVELYKGSTYIDDDNFTDYFTTKKSGSSSDYSGDNAISSITVSSWNTDSVSSLYIEEVDDGEFEAYIEDTISMNTDDILEIRVNTYDSDATVWIESDEDSDIGGDNEWMEIEISSSEWYDGEVVLYITVEDGDGYETFYTLYIYID